MSTDKEKEGKLRRIGSQFSCRPRSSSPDERQCNTFTRPSHETGSSIAKNRKIGEYTLPKSGINNPSGSARRSGNRDSNSCLLGLSSKAAADASKSYNAASTGDQHKLSLSHKPSSLDGNDGELNTANKARSCWEEANLRLEREFQGEFQALLSAAGEISLQKKDLLKCLGSTSNDQKENTKLYQRVERLWRVLQPFRELVQIGARADPHKIAPYAVGGLFSLIQVLLRQSGVRVTTPTFANFPFSYR